jgi:hypothetical protein
MASGPAAGESRSMVIGLAGPRYRRHGNPASDAGGTDLCPPLCSIRWSGLPARTPFPANGSIRVVVRLTKPRAWSIAVVCTVAISCWPRLAAGHGHPWLAQEAKGRGCIRGGLVEILAHRAIIFAPFGPFGPPLSPDPLWKARQHFCGWRAIRPVAIEVA